MIHPITIQGDAFLGHFWYCNWLILCLKLRIKCIILKLQLKLTVTWIKTKAPSPCELTLVWSVSEKTNLQPFPYISEPPSMIHLITLLQSNNSSTNSTPNPNKSNCLDINNRTRLIELLKRGKAVSSSTWGPASKKKGKKKNKKQNNQKKTEQKRAVGQPAV